MASLRVQRPPFALGALAALLSVLAATGLVAAFRGSAPVVALSVVYLLPVLVVSTYWGLVLGVATSLASALAFNFFFLDPTGRLTIADSRNWASLLTLLIVAIALSTVAETARSRAAEAEARRREADLSAALARTLLGGSRLDASLGLAARQLAEVLGAASVAIELGARTSDARHTAIPLRERGVQIGALVLPADVAAAQGAGVRERVVPALELILAAALARDAHQAEAVETASLRRSDELKTALLRSVSHDLRTPVTAAMAGARALRAMDAGDPERAAVERDILDATTRLSRLIDALLDLARLQGAAAAPNSTWCSVEEVLHEAADQAGSFTFAVDPDLPLVRADAAQLERALHNLLENAVRHGGAPVAVRVRATGARLTIRVVDHGPGIPAHEQERVFSPFYRGASGTTTGTGLGLAIARGFVEANGGTLTVESLPGQGATFVLALPVVPVDDEVVVVEA